MNSRPKITSYSQTAVLLFLPAMINLFALHIAQAIDAAPAGREFHVAVGGNDTNPGTAQQPFASFHRAQQAVREERAQHPERGVTVTFHAGSYELPDTLMFGPSDSGGSRDQPVLYRAAIGERVEIHGGRRIEGWQPDPDRPHLWKTRVADPGKEVGTNWRFEQLWINGKRAVRARTPNWWHFHLLRSVAEEKLDDKADQVRHSLGVTWDPLESTCRHASLSIL